MNTNVVGLFFIAAFTLLMGCTDRNISVSVLNSGSLKPNNCAHGEYLSDTTGACEPAGQGYYVANNSNDRLPCEAGYYCSTSRNTSPQGDGLCDGGNFCPSGSIDPEGAGDCLAGYYCPRGSAVAEGAGACSGGTFSGIGQAVCSACTFISGTYPHAVSVAFDPDQTALIADTCTVKEISRCESGYRVNSSGRQTCRAECTSGKYWTGTACDIVPKDNYPAEDNESLNTCPANSETASTGANSKLDCLGKDGFYNCQTGQCSSTQTDASKTTYSPAGSNVLESCPAGYACGTGFKVACGIGAYATGAAQSCLACSNKPENATGVSYASSPTPAESNSCPILTVNTCQSGYAPDNTTKTCRVLCPVGKYYDAGSETCQSVPAGYYTETGTDTKMACPWGSTSNLDNIIGTESVRGRKACFNLAGYKCTGLSNAVVGGPFECTSAPAGHYTFTNNANGTGNTITYQCDAGYDCPAVSCTGTDFASCPPGATNVQGNGMCGPGKYSTAGSTCQSCTNKPLHAVDFTYKYPTMPPTTPLSCPINYITSCDIGWSPSATQQYCETTNPCLQTSALTPGSSCGDGTYYVGETIRNTSTYRLMIPPANCSTVSSITTCTGGSDGPTVLKNFFPTAGGATPMISEDDGASNTAQLTAISSQYTAAQYCSDLTAGTPAYSDWYLPAIKQVEHFANIDFTTRTALGIPSGTYYWSSTGYDSHKALSIDSSAWSPGGTATTTSSSSFVRCMREVEIGP